MGPPSKSEVDWYVTSVPGTGDPESDVWRVPAAVRESQLRQLHTATHRLATSEKLLASAQRVLDQSLTKKEKARLHLAPDRAPALV